MKSCDLVSEKLKSCEQTRKVFTCKTCKKYISGRKYKEQCKNCYFISTSKFKICPTCPTLYIGRRNSCNECYIKECVVCTKCLNYTKRSYTKKILCDPCYQLEKQNLKCCVCSENSSKKWYKTKDKKNDICRKCYCKKSYKEKQINKIKEKQI